MPRTKLVYKADDFPKASGKQSKAEVDALFEHMKTFAGKPEIPGSAGAFAIIAREPRLALLLVKVSDYMTKECPWTTERRDLRQLMIQALNLHYRCDFNFQSHLSSAERDGISAELQACIPLWETSTAFNAEQRLVIEFTFAVCQNAVSDELYEQVVSRFGDQAALEMTIAAAWWAFWAMVAGVIRPDYDFGYGAAEGGK